LQWIVVVNQVVGKKTLDILEINSIVKGYHSSMEVWQAVRFCWLYLTIWPHPRRDVNKTFVKVTGKRVVVSEGLNKVQNVYQL